MSDSQITGLSVFANGVFPVEISAGKRINGSHRVKVQATVDASTGEVWFFIEPGTIEILKRDTEDK